MPDLQTLHLGPSNLDARFYRAGTGEPLLFLHHLAGIPAWGAALENLAQSFDVIAPHQPGWGPAKDDLVRVDNGLDLALFNVDLLDALGIERAHVAGIGFGAWIAAEIAAVFGNRVNGLVLVNPFGIWRAGDPGEDAFAQPPGRGLALLFADPARREELLVGGRDRIDAFVEEQLNLKAGAKFLWPIPDTGVERRLPRIKAPTLVAVSERDRVVPVSYGPIWQAAIPGARLATLAAAGHVADLDEPEAFATLVREWALHGRVAVKSATD